MNIYLAYQRAAVSLGRVRELSDNSSGCWPPRIDNGHARAIQETPQAPQIIFREIRYTPAGANVPLFECFNWTFQVALRSTCVVTPGQERPPLSTCCADSHIRMRGEILLAGVPIDQYELRTLRRAIVVLEASPTLFRGTLLFNLRYGYPEATEAEVHNAAQRAGLDRVAALPDGYETVIGPRGAGLSAGQPATRDCRGAPVATRSSGSRRGNE